MELPRQDRFDAVNLGGRVARRDAGDLADGGGIQPFEIRKDHLAVERFELVDQPQQTVERKLADCAGLAGCGSATASSSSRLTSTPGRKRRCRATYVAATL